MPLSCRLPAGDLVCIFSPHCPTTSPKPCTKGAQALHLSPSAPRAGGEALWQWQPTLGPHSSGHCSHLLPWELLPQPLFPATAQVATQTVVPGGLQGLSTHQGSSQEHAGAAVMSKNIILSNKDRPKVNPQASKSSGCLFSVSSAG